MKNNEKINPLLAVMLRPFICLLLVIFTCNAPTFAWHIPAYYSPENGLGGITGKIMGGLQPVDRVSVVLVQDDKVIDKTETDKDGFYKFGYVAEGKYGIKASKDGYRTCIVIRIPVAPDRVTKLDFYLPEFNNGHMPTTPVVEPYGYYYRLMDHPDISYPH